MSTHVFFRNLLLAASLSQACAAAESQISYNRDIRPILSKNCFACHGRDEESRKAELRLDERDAAIAPNELGETAIVPGNAEASSIWQRVTAADHVDLMPPPETGKTLTDEEKSTLKEWIQQGAPYQAHWAYEPPVNAPVPANGAPNPVDAYLREAVGKAGLTIMPEADRQTLIRRVSFTLTGLPPSQEELSQYLNDVSPKAYERMVERYLASPHYGEEMARNWLDIARYGDTHGLHLDNERHIWLYRDWVVNSFNANQPFNQFTIEQLAGDQLPDARPEQLIATGFTRSNVTTGEGGSIDAEYLNRYATERAGTIMQAWLGLTGACASCHDHKFDPITAKDFYSMYAFFYSNADPAMDGNAAQTAPVAALSNPDLDAQIQAAESEIAAKTSELGQAAAAIAYRDPADSLIPVSEQKVETVLFDEGFPDGAKPQAEPRAVKMNLISKNDGPVQSGEKALRRAAEGLGQDFYESGVEPLYVPENAVIRAHVFLQPETLPDAIMLQFRTENWRNRIVWGNVDSINYGAKGTTERVDGGPLPTPGAWVELEFPAEKIGLPAGTPLTGFAMTQFNGSVVWDNVRLMGTMNPVQNPRISFLAWWKSTMKNPPQNLPGELAEFFQRGPEQQDPEAEQTKALRQFYLTYIHETHSKELGPRLAGINDLRARLDELKNSVPKSLIFKDLDSPRQAYVMLRGDYTAQGEPVDPATPAFLPALKKEGQRATRLDLAKWIVAPENPLTARVTVNRLWQQVFGYGLVKTSGDFGSQGELPSHPELLDWLAIDFAKNGWDVKRLMKQMLYTEAFRRSSAAPPDQWAADPENRFLARGPRQRLAAEQIRDNALFVSGLLNAQMGGPGVRPYQPPNIWEAVAYTDSNTRFYKPDSGSALYRRSLYTFLKRTAPAPFMANFDAPSREDFCARRESSNTPLQALQLMNDVQHVEAARFLAERMMREGGSTPEQRVAFAWRTVLSREPAADESQWTVEQYQTHLAHFTAEPGAAAEFLKTGEKPADATLNASELAAWALVAGMVMNLDETVTRN